jgi:hypothetical protein
MVDDIVFYGQYFFMDLPIFSSGTIVLIEAQTEYFPLKLALPERISIS